MKNIEELLAVMIGIIIALCLIFMVFGDIITNTNTGAVQNLTKSGVDLLDSVVGSGLILAVILLIMATIFFILVISMIKGMSKGKKTF